MKEVFFYLTSPLMGGNHLILEGVNNKIKTLVKQACGSKDLVFFKLDNPRL